MVSLLAVGEVYWPNEKFAAQINPSFIILSLLFLSCA